MPRFKPLINSTYKLNGSVNNKHIPPKTPVGLIIRSTREDFATNTQKNLLIDLTKQIRETQIKSGKRSKSKPKSRGTELTSLVMGIVKQIIK